MRHSHLDLTDRDKLEGEEPSLYEVLRVRRRQDARETTQVIDPQGRTHETPRGIRDTFVDYLRAKYMPIEVEEADLQALQRVLPHTPTATYEAELEWPISAEELGSVLREGAKKKSLGIDGLSLEFYTANWDTISTDLVQLLNHVFLGKHISLNQKHGIVLSLPKNSNPRTINDYRPITLLTTEYKLLAKVLAQRLRRVVADQLQGTQ
jgi:hypothetical protein